MSAEQTLERLQRFFPLLIGAICLGTMVELWLTEYMGSFVQYLPFIFCGAGFLAVVLFLSRPKQRTFTILRVVMILVAIGGLFGIYEHLEHNFEFELEIRPNAVMSDVILDALKGASSLFAPGILSITALLALASTY